MPKWTKGNSGYAGKGKGQGKSDLPTDIPARYDEAFLEEMDARSEVYKMMSQRLLSLVTSLGGLDGLSYQERSLCKRAIHLERLIEKRELTLAINGTIDEPGYFNAINALSGLYTKLGLKRRAKQISLRDYLNHANKPEPPSAPSPAPSGSQPFHREDANGKQRIDDQ
ncbi:MAG: hypothetical protein E8D42_14275 [Nitrospira sp.]|nr:MAG: hypothetical protein E8D42_14275 [Nitrospira sp.]